MKFIVSSSALLKQLQQINGVINANTVLPILEDFLFEVGLDVSDVTTEVESGFRWPTFINTSIARPKTIIPIASLERLHAATPPQNPEKFREMCNSIDSTGKDIVFVCIDRYQGSLK